MLNSLVPDYMKNRNSKGFTLMEVIIGIGLMAMVISMFFCILHFTSMCNDLILNTDDYLLDGRFALGYIRDDVTTGLDVLSINSINNITNKYPENMGFIVRAFDSENSRYKFIFYTKNQDVLIRHTFSSPLDEPPSYNNSEGYNTIVKNVQSLEGCEIDTYNNVMILSLVLKDKKSSKTYEFIETISLLDDIN